MKTLWILLLFTTSVVTSFLGPAHKLLRSKILFSFQNNNDDDDKASIFYNDFESTIIGDVSHAIQDIQDRIQQTESRIQDNWQKASWQVRGFSLLDDDSNAAVSCIASDDDDDDEHIYVGRTDGTLFRIAIGTEFMTSFISQGGGELVREDTPSSQLETPFEILSQTNAHTAAISAILPIGDKLFTVSGSEIRQWTVQEQDSTMQEGILLSGVHEQPILHIDSITYQDHECIVSISCDGSVAFWDVQTGSVVQSFHLTWDDQPILVQAATSDDTKIAIGNDIGQIMVYSLSNLQNAASEAQNVLPDQCWIGAETGITALNFGGPGSFSRGDVQSVILLSGAVDGTIRQWEIMTQRDRLEYWPKMASQRMPKRAHLFEGHYDAVTVLQPVDDAKFLSASKDGTIRAWSPSTGNEIFRMDGFTENTSSLCVKDDTLITDGMQGFVNLHAFDVDLSNDKDIDLDAW